ncbi:serine hydrolase [Winogradskyella sp. 3972H.M.0a.05]|uniref:serine hydrolase domain-containing protein n=1 Tax=Winogradskyella sp. 3972H.M.0a.05 TaxID=2950277 RepID=UPI0033910F17
MKLKFSFYLIVLLIISCSCKVERKRSINTQALDEVVKSVMDDNNIHGLSVAVVKGNDTKFLESYGVLHNGTETKVDSETLFSAQSLSKTFTALAVIVAEQEQLLKLDSPIIEYLPEFKVGSVHEKNASARITLRHLLSHTSGLPADAPVGNIFSPSFNNYDSFPLSERVLSVNNVWLKDSVGVNYNYSNIGFDIAAHIIEKVSGQSFSEYLREHILIPLKMKNSTFELNTIPSHSNRARGHCFGVNEELPVLFSSVGAGGLYTTVADMSNFLKSAINQFQEILNQKSHDEFIRIPFSKRNNGYALGIQVNEVNYCVPYYSHTGNGFGFTATMAWFPTESLGMVILSNRESVYSGLTSIQQTILEHYAKPDFLKSNCTDIDEYPKEIKKEEISYYQSISGGYSNGNVLLEFELRGNKFGVLSPSNGDFNAFHFVSKNHWVFRDGTETIHFKLKNDRLTNLNNGMTFSKIANHTNANAKSNPLWENYEGRYRAYAYGVLESVENIELINGHLHLNGNMLYEKFPNIFFDQFGQVVDFSQGNAKIEYASYHKID